VNETKFLNLSQPQTLVIATILLYVNAFFDFFLLGIFVLIAIASAAGGYGIANERRWGYGLAVGASIVKVVAVFAATNVFSGTNIIPFLFDVALVALLLHPMSRDYQKIWFR
jgi:hypothetical protein